MAGFADATGRQLPLVCTLNGAPVLAAVTTMLGVDFDEMDRLALSAPAGAEGLTLVPYFEGERSPNLPGGGRRVARGDDTKSQPANVARAAVEGLLVRWRTASTRSPRRVSTCDASSWSAGERARRRSGASHPRSWAHPCTCRRPPSTSRLGAARQAAWTLSQQDSPPSWSFGVTASYTADPTPQVLEQYRAAQPLTLGQ